MKAADPEAGMSSVLRGELLRDNANLSNTAVMMIIKGTHGDYSYDVVKRVLLEQHSRIQLEETGDKRHRRDHKTHDDRKLAGWHSRGRF